MIRHRLLRLRRLLRQRKIEAFIVTALPHVRYLTGFSGSNAVCIVGQRTALFFSDPRYDIQSRAEVRGWRRVISGEGLVAAAAREGLPAGVRRVGFDSASLTYAGYREWKKAFPEARFAPTSGLLDALTTVKDAAEMRLIRRAIAISEEVYRETLPLIRPGVREVDIAAEITYRQRRAGADGDAFTPIVASGPRGALPHAHATERKIRSGDLLTLDFGCTVKGYSSDITRTVGVGAVSAPLRRMYAAVLEAQEAAIAAARPGMAARDLDAVARGVLDARGYGRYFRHGLGHGLGLALHERPRLSPLSTETLLEGMVITIEPGAYVPEAGGVRIEDDILLGDGGCTVLTTLPKKLVLL